MKVRVQSEHEYKVNSFIPFAEKLANRKVPDWKSGKNKRDEWDKIFCSEMDRLTILAGLRVSLKGE